MKTIGFGVAAALLLIAMQAAAQVAVVEAVQYPAWLERGGHAVALSPGTGLQPRDRIRTGSNARVQLKLAEGSAVKLGENAQLVIEKAEDRGIFRATLALISGAFRFTTDTFRRRPRDVSIKVKNVTAGIRGTDLWGKSTEARDLVCLLEGKITVGSQGHPTVTLDQRLDFYQKPRDGAPEVAKVDEKQIAQWAQETEISPDGPAARSGGTWRVLAAIFGARDEALALNRTLRANGYPSEVIVTPSGGFIVQVAGLAGESEARALMANLRNLKGVETPAVSQ
ncbi:MAG TPA: FecR domain-containing protein [Usitatibacter sp.]|nr:FecR domain-containing protein [Usitatibacter sp.]